MIVSHHLIRWLLLWYNEAPGKFTTQIHKQAKNSSFGAFKMLHPWTMQALLADVSAWNYLFPGVWYLPPAWPNKRTTMDSQTFLVLCLPALAMLFVFFSIWYAKRFPDLDLATSLVDSATWNTLSSEGGCFRYMLCSCSCRYCCLWMFMKEVFLSFFVGRSLVPPRAFVAKQGSLMNGFFFLDSGNSAMHKFRNWTSRFIYTSCWGSDDEAIRNERGTDSYTFCIIIYKVSSSLHFTSLHFTVLSLLHFTVGCEPLVFPCWLSLSYVRIPRRTLRTLPQPHCRERKKLASFA